MAEEQTPTKNYNQLYDSLTSQTVGDRSFADMYGALQEAEVGAYKDKTGWPYIFTGASRKSSAFGPLQITYSTALGYFYPGDSETEQRDNMKSGNFKEGYTQLPSDVKSYIKEFIEQGINKRNNKGGVYSSFGVGDISSENHKKYYPFLAAVHVNEKKKIADADTVPSFINAHFGKIREDDPKKEDKERQLSNLQTKVSDTLGVNVRPVTKDVTKDFSELGTVTPEPEPAPETNQTEQAFTLDYPGELPDIGDSVDMPDDPDVTPPAEVESMMEQKPKEKNIFERTIDYFFPEEDLEKLQERDAVRDELLEELDRSSTPKMNKGGAVMKEQMEMFEDGGLMDEGGTVDPVSGNEVPSGSTQKEVRDDIPAQLSEGEFVFPADVVRYFGLETLMKMRQEAKAGLARMEAMGQMGNSEEAVLPDDIPFDLYDLDIEDETMEFQTGGFVPNPNPSDIYQQPSQFAQYSQQPYQPPTVPFTPQPIQTGFTPPTTPVTPTDSTFEQLLPTTTGRYDELKEYENKETGQKMTIPFVNGNPIYPIPTGFTPVDTDIIEPAEVTAPSARVTEERGGGGRDEQEDLGYSTTDPTGIAFDKSKLSPSLKETVSKYGLGFAGLAEMFGGAGFSGVVKSLFGGEEKAKENSLSSAAFGGVLDSFRGGNVSFSRSEALSGIKDGVYDNQTPMNELSTVVQAQIANVTEQVIAELQEDFLDEDGNPISAEEAKENVNNRAKRLGISTTISGTNISKRTETIVREISEKRAEQIREEREAAQARANAAAQASYERAVQASKTDKSTTYEGGGESLGDARSEGRDPTGTEGAIGGEPDAPVGMSDFGDYKGAFVGKKYIEKKGLATKKRKPKKMKQSGLASKK
jgi:hypothetical protein